MVVSETGLDLRGNMGSGIRFTRYASAFRLSQLLQAADLGVELTAVLGVLVWVDMPHNETTNRCVNQRLVDGRAVRFVGAEDGIDGFTKRSFERFGIGAVLAGLQRAHVEHREVGLEFTSIHGGCRVGGGKLELPVVSVAIFVGFDRGLHDLQLYIRLREDRNVGVYALEVDIN
ncbi:hypothetical protein UFOVP1319_25 [uncultured Caudovirales phage]|uniref:Uncharacterized protein n=1 Tax=uncultured Caudovirales phage TaxID=2100421 RepID=A0A6J5MJA0_9CAUD|nr:hypothetical protein UFOVP478_8 [uncultured Caudovirales phage]CAB4191432.1 hypothetical protein UFOVP1225_35 [uncultured Caudovirales phage]CAB4197628.1 hypothetical protein UFOVP1319_25 [uncultured Caudovirales phage]CAB4217502.1 hypothetical protein UFOVP1591_35 [uncultured Caudovirales phage]